MGPSALSLEQGIKAVADTANQSGGAAIRVPQRRRHLGLDTGHYRSLSRAQKQANHRPQRGPGGTDELADSLQDSLPPRAGPLMLTLTDGTFWHPSEIA